MKTKKIAAAIVAGVVLAGVALVAKPRPVHAQAGSNFGFLCNVEFNPNSQLGGTNFGNNGFIRFILTSSPGCSGSTIVQGALCTVPGTDPSCYQPEEYSGPEILALYQSMVTAEVANREVIAVMSTNAQAEGIAFR